MKSAHKIQISSTSSAKVGPKINFLKKVKAETELYVDNFCFLLKRQTAIELLIVRHFQVLVISEFDQDLIKI